MPEAFIVDAVRTPVGKRGGGLAEMHPADMGAHVLNALVDRTGVDPEAVEDVVFGCVDALGPQAGDIARTAWLSAGLPEGVPGTTIDRQCGSAQQAVHFAAQGVMSGTQDLVVAGGVQNMSQIPIGSAMTAAEQFGFTEGPFHGSKGWIERYGDQEVSQFRGAEMIAENQLGDQIYATPVIVDSQIFVRVAHFEGDDARVEKLYCLEETPKSEVK